MMLRFVLLFFLLHKKFLHFLCSLRMEIREMMEMKELGGEQI
jgi:hypothetical protein